MKMTAFSAEGDLEDGADLPMEVVAATVLAMFVAEQVTEMHITLIDGTMMTVTA